MTNERETEPNRDDDRARHAAQHPLETAETPATGKEKMVLRRHAAPIAIGVIAVVVLLAIVLM